jgi:hypothetical protein
MYVLGFGYLGQCCSIGAETKDDPKEVSSRVHAYSPSLYESKH